VVAVEVAVVVVVVVAVAVAVEIGVGDRWGTVAWSVNERKCPGVRDRWELPASLISACSRPCARRR
jgi:hypothetical protein